MAMVDPRSSSMDWRHAWEPGRGLRIEISLTHSENTAGTVAVIHPAWNRTALFQIRLPDSSFPNAIKNRLKMLLIGAIPLVALL